MRISLTIIALLGCTLVHSVKNSNGNVERTIDEIKNDQQHFNDFEVRIELESNGVNNLLEIPKYDITLGNAFGKIGQFMKQKFFGLVASSETPIDARKLSMVKLSERTRIELLTAIKSLQEEFSKS